MKITRNTDDHLVLDDRPWFWGIVLGSLFLLFASIAINGAIDRVPEAIFGGLIGCTVVGICGYVFVQRVQIVFDRPNNFVEFRTKNLRQQLTVRHELQEIDKAIVQTTTDDDGVLMSRLAFTIPDGQSRGTHPATEVYSSGWPAEKICQTVNLWLNRN